MELSNQNITQSQLRELLDKMGISKAMIIDDKVHDNTEAIYDIVDGAHDTEDFKINELLNKLSLTKSQVKQLDKIPKKLLTPLKKRFPSIINSEIESLKTVVYELFNKRDVKLYDSATTKVSFSSDTILFLDYRLDNSEITSEMLTKLLAQKATDTNLPRCIVFISKDQTFSLSQDHYNMKDSTDKYKYFRDLRNQQQWKEYKNSIYDYINKTTINNVESVRNELYSVLHNLYGGQQFFKLLYQIESVLDKSSEKVLGKFHLLNARSIQEMIREKVVEEGESESSFIMNWISRHIAKTVIQDDTFTTEIHATLKEIDSWTESFYEIHEDVALKEILLSEMWDEKINQRLFPIDFGDVFKIMYNNEPRRAILLTQTCTIAVRGDGGRSGKVALLAVENPSKFGTKSGVTIDDKDGEALTFDLDDTISYPMSLLDITSLNTDGKAKLRGENGNIASYLPENVLWSEGYRKMMIDLVKSLLDKLIQSQNNVVQIDQTWIPYNNSNSTHSQLNYEFPISRLYRLDQKYASYVFQAAQSWWGRVGLPVDINFMNDYEEKEGKIRIHGAEYPATFYLKRKLNEIPDVGVSLEDLVRAINAVYEDDDVICAEIEEIFKDPQLARLHYSSGKKMMSLKQQKLALELLSGHEIHIKCDLEDQPVAELSIGKFSKCFLEEKEITKFVARFSADINGRYKFLMSKELLERLQLLNNIPSFQNRVTQHQEIGEAINMNTSDKSIFEYRITGNNLNILVRKDKITTEQLAAALKLI